MDNEWNYNEELEPMPEHHIDPEYTPEYPDVTFFKESYVTMREDNIFQGETPQGESPRNIKKEKQAKRSRMSWFRKFLGSAMRGGAAIVAASALIVNAAEGDSSAAARRIKEMMIPLHEDAIEQPSDYTPDEFEALWDSDPEAPHRYDYSKLIVLREATCTKPGVSCYVCTDCGVQLKQATYKAHEAAPSVRENIVNPDCTHDGSYEEVTFCKVCGTEMSRVHRVLFATGHTQDEYVVENHVDPNCTENGSEDYVYYCTDCGEEISRTTVLLEALGHVGDEPVVENVIDPSCTEDGSEEQVVYCTVCGEEVSRTVVVLEATGHTEDEPVIENKVAATCTKSGSQDEVVYCGVCGEELSRTSVVLDALGHKYTAKVTSPTCTAQGYTTHTCSRCGNSYKDTYKAALGHNYKATVTKPTCTAQGYTTHKCSRCGNSYKDTYKKALGHNFNIQTWNSNNPLTTCSRGCGTYAFTITFSSANKLSYNINATFWEQAHNMGLGHFSWGDLWAYTDPNDPYGSEAGFYQTGYGVATSRTGTILLDFTPAAGTTYYYKLVLRVATGTGSDDVCYVVPKGGRTQSYTQH